MDLALVITARRLRPYFLKHPIGVRTNLPLKQILSKPDTSSRMVKWEVELSEYDISYLPQTIIKAQTLTDFVSEMTKEEPPSNSIWLLHVDTSATSQGSGAGTAITYPQSEGMEFVVRFDVKTSNNEVEYEALAIGMKMTHEAEAKHLTAYLDSQLVIKYMDKTYKIK
ncbi:UNVERIFIED_CONTAM: hypothetical protein Sradi_1575500 [Sesamum radiatum]|uniref:RNase H type-1 domain-containing protein n=1 Tax=Sesamum radiatum TaxID=300843 RepID=A0AAW2UAA1_SESRA